MGALVSIYDAAMALVKIYIDSRDLLGLLLDTSNGPLTGNLGITKADPELRLTDSGNSEYSRLMRADTNNLMSLKNRTLSQGAAGYAINLAVNTQYGWVADNVNHDIELSDFTVGIWIKTTAATGNCGIFTKMLSTGGTNYWGLANYSSSLQWYFGSGLGTVNVAYAWTNINDGNWHLIAGVLDRDGNQTLYVDGVSRGTPIDISSKSAVSFNNVSRTSIGSYSNTSGGLVGQLDDGFIYKGRALTAGELLEIYNAGVGKYLNPADTFTSSGLSVGTNLTSLYHFDEGTGTTVTDSVSAINMALVNTADVNWVAGLFNVPGSMSESTIIDSRDGSDPLEHAINRFNNDNDARGVINGKDVRIEVAGAEQVKVTDGYVNPITTNDIDLGTAALMYKNMYLKNEYVEWSNALCYEGEVLTYDDEILYYL